MLVNNSLAAEYAKKTPKFNGRSPSKIKNIQSHKNIEPKKNNLYD